MSKLTHLRHRVYAGAQSREGILFPYGASAGDIPLPGNDDVCSDRIDTSYSIPFKENMYNRFYVSLQYKSVFRNNAELT